MQLMESVAKDMLTQRAPISQEYALNTYPFFNVIVFSGKWVSGKQAYLGIFLWNMELMALDIC